MWGSRAGVVVIALLLGTLAACGEEPAAPAARATSSAAGPTRPPTPAPAPTQSADSDGDRVPPLPALSTAPPTVPPGDPAGSRRRVFGADISWPQCPKGMGIPEKRSEGAPMPTEAAEFVVLGLTNGPSFVANPCLDTQLAWVRDRHLMAAAYSVVSFPDARTREELGDDGPFAGGTRLGALRNVGYQAALFNIATMARVGLRTPAVWIDVEPVTHFDWSADVVANAAVVQGMARGYQDGGFRIGFYSIGSLWTRVVGSLRFGAPEWRPAGARGLAEALDRCGDDWSFQGGRAVLGQWVEDGRDRNVTCPGGVAELRDWFHQY